MIKNPKKKYLDKKIDIQGVAQTWSDNDIVPVFVQEYIKKISINYDSRKIVYDTFRPDKVTNSYKVESVIKIDKTHSFATAINDYFEAVEANKIYNADVTTPLNFVLTLVKNSDGIGLVKSLELLADIDKCTRSDATVLACYWEIITEGLIIKGFKYGQESKGNTIWNHNQLQFTIERKFNVDSEVANLVIGNLLKRSIIIKTGDFYTTKTVLKTDVELARICKEKTRPLCVEPVVLNKVKISGTEYEYTQEQSNFISKIFSSESKVISANAPAGTGKTFTIISAIGECLSIGLVTAVVCPMGSPAKKISTDLNNAGYLASDLFNHSATTIDGFKFSGGLETVEVLFIEEASTVSTHHLSFITKMKNLRKVIFIGDTCQLRPIASGQPFRDIQKFTTVEKIELTKSMRQKSEETVLEHAKIRNEQEGVFHDIFAFKKGNWDKEDVFKRATFQENFDKFFDYLELLFQEKWTLLAHTNASVDSLTQLWISKMKGYPVAYQRQLTLDVLKTYFGKTNETDWSKRLWLNDLVGTKVLYTGTPFKLTKKDKLYTGDVGTVCERNQISFVLQERGTSNLKTFMVDFEDIKFSLCLTTILTTTRSQGMTVDKSVYIAKDFNGDFDYEHFYVALSRGKYASKAVTLMDIPKEVKLKFSGERQTVLGMSN